MLLDATRFASMNFNIHPFVVFGVEAGVVHEHFAVDVINFTNFCIAPFIDSIKAINMLTHVVLCWPCRLDFSDCLCTKTLNHLL